MAKIMIVAGLGSSLIRFRGDLIKSWLNLGYEVVAAAPGREVEQQLTELGVPYYSIPLKRTSLNPLTDLTLTCSLIRIIKKEKPPYLFLYTVKPVIYGSLAVLLNRKTVVYSMITGLGYALSGKPGKRTFLETLVTRLYRFALKSNKLVFFQNPDDLNAFINLNIVTADRAFQVNGSGVNVEYFSPANLPIGPPTFLLIARLLREKGIIEFIEAAKVIKTKYPETCFSMVGWSFDENPSAISAAQVEQWQGEGFVEIYGETDDVRPYIDAASVYVLPSYREGTPRTVLEAMAMGRPVITTDVPGCRETVVDGVNGFLVPVRNNEALVKAMERFIAEPGLIAQMGAESRRIAEEKYDVHKVNKVINEAMGLG